MDCLVKFDYTAQGSRELTIKEGDKIVNAELVDDGWYKGTLIERMGLLPEICLKLRFNSIPPELVSLLEFEVHKEYTAQTPDELTIHENDVIGNVTPSIDGWSMGTLMSTPALFPGDKVKILVDEFSENLFENMEFQVIYDYTALNQDELTLQKGDIIENVQFVKTGWNKGKLKDKFGLFPDTFVKSNLEKVSAELLSFMEFVVKYDFTPGRPDELKLQKGDIIRNVEKVFSGWNKGTCNGRNGIFSELFVKIRNPSEEILSQLEFIATSDFIIEPTEYLTIRKGDDITKAKPSRDGWFEGTLIGKTGMFPDDLVKIANASSEQLKNKEFIVTSDYDSRNPEEMSIKKGDIMHKAQFVRDGWYSGIKKGKSGIFKDSFVTLREATLSANFLAMLEFVAHSGYVATMSDKISLEKGDVVKDVQFISKGWLKGTICGKTGIFPSNFVEVTNLPIDPMSEAVTQNVQRMVLTERDIPEELLCPICLELPAQEIYQCKNGHTLCATCLQSITICPQCRINLKVEGGLIRNRVAESLVSIFKARLG